MPVRRVQPLIYEYKRLYTASELWVMGYEKGLKGYGDLNHSAKNPVLPRFLDFFSKILGLFGVIFEYSKKLGMHTLTLQVTNESALKTIQSLEQKQLIKIVEDTNLDSPALAGAPLSLKAFKNWIHDAESTNTISLKEAKSKWAEKRKQLQQISR